MICKCCDGNGGIGDYVWDNDDDDCDGRGIGDYVRDNDDDDCDDGGIGDYRLG